MARKTTLLNDMPRNAPGMAMIPNDSHTPVAEHTPTPWRLLDEENRVLILADKPRTGHAQWPLVVAEVRKGGKGSHRGEKRHYLPLDPERQTNLDFLFRAANAYDRDQKTIRELTEALEKCAKYGTPDIIEYARAALDRAKKVGE